MHLLLVHPDTLQRAIKNLLHGILGYLLDGCFQGKSPGFQNTFYLPEYHLVLILSKGNNTTRVDALFRIGYHLVQVYLVDDSQPLASGTSTLGRIEREDIGCGVAISQPRNRIHESLGEVFQFSSVLVHHHQHAISLLHGYLHALAQPLVVLVPYSQLVYHHFYIVVFIAVHLHALADFTEFTIHPDVQVTFSSQTFEKLSVMAFALPHQWRQDQDALTRIVTVYHLQDLLLIIFHHFLACQIAIGRTCTGVEQAQIVIDFRGGAHGGARILVGGLLLDADDRAQARNLVHVRSLHIAQKIAGVSGESLYIPALSLGEYGIEGQRGLTRSRKPRDNRQ